VGINRVASGGAAAAALIVAFMSNPEARAQVGNPGILLTEFGYGAIHFPGTASSPIAGFPMPDPGPGGLPNALTYDLLGPPGLVTGDLILQDVAGGPMSDVIRFNFGPAGAFAVFYSALPEPGEPATPADIGFPTAFYPNQAMLLEVAIPIPGGFGVIYTPAPNQPGFIPGVGVTYTIQSELPAPNSAVLLGLGGLMAGSRRRR
jgi:hypothetical protein